MLFHGKTPVFPLNRVVFHAAMLNQSRDYSRVGRNVTV